MMTHDEFVEKECRLCGTQRCYGVDYCGKYKTEVLGEEDPIQAVYEVIHNSKSNNDLGFGENWVSESPEMPDEDRELAEAAQEAHDELVRSLVEAGGEIRELKDDKKRLIFALKEAVTWLDYFLTTERDDIYYDDANEVRCRAEYLLMDMEDE